MEDFLNYKTIWDSSFLITFLIYSIITGVSILSSGVSFGTEFLLGHPSSMPGPASLHVHPGTVPLALERCYSKNFWYLSVMRGLLSHHCPSVGGWSLLSPSSTEHSAQRPSALPWRTRRHVLSKAHRGFPGIQNKYKQKHSEHSVRDKTLDTLHRPQQAEPPSFRTNNLIILNQMFLLLRSVFTLLVNMYLCFSLKLYVRGIILYNPPIISFFKFIHFHFPVYFIE